MDLCSQLAGRHRSRRRFLTGAGAALLTHSVAKGEAFTSEPHTIPIPKALTTPYKIEKLILRASGKPGEFDEKSVDGPFVFRHNGGFRMTYIGFDGIGYQTGIAASEDLVSWRKVGAILRRDPQSAVTRYNIALTWILRENGVFSAGRLRKVRGEFLGAWHAYPSPGYEQGPAVIGLARSEDLLHWRLDSPCLSAADSGAGPWERGGLYKPCLLESSGRYYLIYNAKTEPEGKRRGWREQIGLAWSDDLKTWTRYPGNPIIANGPAGSLDDRFASDPCVLRFRDRWAFFYYGLSSRRKARDLLALGQDLFHPVKAEGILVDAGPPGSIDDDFAHKPSILAHRGDLYHFYCAVSGKYPHDVRGISVARSRPWPAGTAKES